MERIAFIFIKWFVQKLVTLAAIILVLVGLYWLQDHWRSLAAIQVAVKNFDASLATEKQNLEALKVKLEKAAKEADEILKKLAEFEKLAEKATFAEEAALLKLNQLRDEKWFFQHPLWSKLAQDIEVAEGAYEAKKVAARGARATVAAFRKRNSSSEAIGLEAQVAEKESQIETLQGERDALEKVIHGDWWNRFLVKVGEVLPYALLILAGVVLTPWLIKVFLYFLVAPLASRIAPVRILPLAIPPGPPGPVISAVSIPIEVAPDQEMLVHGDFLQTTDLPARKRTQLFLNRSLPFTSIAAGMATLTAIRPVGEKSARVVVSSTKDPLGEVALLEIPAGAAMVVHPRALAGVLKPAAGSVRITRHWRLCSLHSWITCQFRYLAFHGPCTLILKGCRGVRAESPDPDAPRLLNQSATLGFSAHFDYSNSRCETFWSYFTGKEDLFNDLFAGQSGVYVYEEMPDSRRKTGISGRGIEGILDTALKAFGI
jgi:hypothetical protein